MKFNKKYFFVFISVFFITLLSGTYFYLNSKLSNESIRQSISDFMLTNYPDIDFSLGKIQYGVFPVIWVEVDQVELKLKDQRVYASKQLLTSNKIYLSVPIWKIIFNKGDIDFQLNRVSINLEKNKSSSNWHNALKLDAAKPEQVPVSNQTDGAVNNDQEKMNWAMPILANAKLGVSITGLEVFYKDGANKYNIVLNSLNLKNLSMKEKSEVQVDTDIQYAPKQKLSLSVNGLLDIPSFIKDKKLSSNFEMKISKWTVHPYLESNTVNLSLVLDYQEQVVSGSVKGNIAKDILFQTKFKLDPSGLMILDESEVKLDLNIYNKLAAAQDNFTLESGLLAIKGRGEFSAKQIKPNFQVSTENEIALLVLGEKVKVNLSAKLDSSNIQWKVLTKALKGQVDSQGQFAYVKTEQGVDILSPVKHKLVFADLELNPLLALAQEKQKAVAAESAPATAPATENTQAPSAAPQQQKAPKIPSTENSVVLKNIKLDQTQIQGQFNVLTQKDKVVIEKLGIDLFQGHLSGAMLVEMQNEVIKVRPNFELSKLQLAKVSFLTKDYFEFYEGDLSGSLSGEILKKANLLTYDLNYQVHSGQGRFNASFINQALKSTLAQVSLFKDNPQLQSLKIKDQYTKLSTIGRMTHQWIDLQKLEFQGPENTYLIEMVGKVFLKDEASRMECNLTDYSGPLGAFLQKQINSRQVPLVFKGPGTQLSVDYQYTLAYLSKKFLENEVKKNETKIIQKAQETIGKELKKTIDEKQIKGLFKKLF